MTVRRNYVRELWYAPDLTIRNEPLIKSLWEYRLERDRWRIPPTEVGVFETNLVSSRLEGGPGLHLAILDIDILNSVTEDQLIVRIEGASPTQRLGAKLLRKVWDDVYGAAGRTQLLDYRNDVVLRLELGPEDKVVDSPTPGHTHVYLQEPITTWQWRKLMFALYLAGVIEMGFFVWSLRRGANFVRAQGIEKTDAERVLPEYGWFFRAR